MHSFFTSIAFRKGSLALLCLLISYAGLQAQLLHQCTVQFATNQHQLSPKAQQQLDSIKALLTNIPDAYRIEITAHTDAVGGAAFNQRLSERRAKAVAQHYSTFSNIRLQSMGLRQPIGDNESEAGKALNRRADVAIYVDVAPPEAIGSYQLKSSRYRLIAEKGGTFLHAPSGTQLRIPPSIFVYDNGQLVTGSVELEYIEYRDPIDFILSGLPMSNINQNTGDHFHSAGMFSIQAYKDGVAVDVQEGKQVTVDFVPTGSLENMSFFQLDAQQNHWANLQNLGTTNGGLIGPVDGSMVGNGWGVAPITPCSYTQSQALYFLGRHGTAFLDTVPDFNAYVAFADSLYRYQRPNAQKEVNKSKQDIENNDLGLENAYRDLISNRSSYSVPNKRRRFTRRAELSLAKPYHGDIISRHKGQQMPSSPFGDVRWIARLERKDTVIFQAPWKEVNVTPTGQKNRYNLQFTLSIDGNDQQHLLQNVLMRPERGTRPRQRPHVLSRAMRRYANIQQNYQRASEKIAELMVIDSTLQLVYNQRKQWLNTIDSIYTLRQSIICFHSQNVSLMTQTEQAQSIEDWYDWVLPNKDTLRQRYANLKNSAYYKSIENQMKNYFAQQRALQNNRIAQQQRQEILRQTMRSLGVQQMGVYNCDQLKRLPNATELLAKYEDTQGNPIEAVVAYLITPSMNGAIRFDGYLGFSPYNLKYSRGAKNTLLVFDTKGKAYKVAAHQFNNLPRQGQITTLKASLIPSATSKELLLPQL